MTRRRTILALLGSAVAFAAALDGAEVEYLRPFCFQIVDSVAKIRPLVIDLRPSRGGVRGDFVEPQGLAEGSGVHIADPSQPDALDTAYTRMFVVPTSSLQTAYGPVRAGDTVLTAQGHLIQVEATGEPVAKLSDPALRAGVLWRDGATYHWESRPVTPLVSSYRTSNTEIRVNTWITIRGREHKIIAIGADGRVLVQMFQLDGIGSSFQIFSASQL